jgi:hypothetical protein
MGYQEDFFRAVPYEPIFAGFEKIGSLNCPHDRMVGG